MMRIHRVLTSIIDLKLLLVCSSLADLCKLDSQNVSNGFWRESVPIGSDLAYDICEGLMQLLINILLQTPF